jgi:hypothetical protein
MVLNFGSDVLFDDMQNLKGVRETEVEVNSTNDGMKNYETFRWILIVRYTKVKAIPVTGHEGP